MRADARVKRQDILDAAWTLFAERGTDVPMRTVAETAGVGYATLYRHFPTSDDLLAGLVNEVFGRVAGVLSRHESGWADDPAGTWSAMVHELASLGFGALAFRLGPIAKDSAALRDSAQERHSEAFALLDAAVARARREGLVDPAISVQSFFAGLAAVTRPMPPGLEERLPGQAAWLVDVYLRGLRPADGVDVPSATPVDRMVPSLVTGTYRVAGR